MTSTATRTLPESDLHHERYYVYHFALEFATAAESIVRRIPRARVDLARRLRSAATTIPLHLAAAAGELAGAEKVRLLRLARLSSSRSAAILDICGKVGAGHPPELAAGRERLVRIVRMIDNLIRNHRGSAAA